LSEQQRPEPKFFPKLYKAASKGKEQEWWIRVIPVPTVGSPPGVYDCADIVTTHGQVDGKQQTATVHVTQGKNLGKANATTAYEQAVSEAESKWKKQLDKGYSEQRGGGSMELLPMLAHKYEDRKHKVDFGCAFVQPKLDGVRALAIKKGGVVTLLSRQGKEHKGLDHIRRTLYAMMDDGEVWDGELYVHGMAFQQLLSLVKKDQSDSIKVAYHVYDMVADKPFKERYVDSLGLTRIWSFGQCPMCVFPVDTVPVGSAVEVGSAHAHCVENGYEGLMLRWGVEPYKSGYRSEHLLKVKAFEDAEFEILDVVPGVGKEADKGTFVCKTDRGAVFNCRPRGRDGLRAEYLANREHYKGRQLTVEFFEWTTSDPPVPRFPVGKAIRED